VWLTTSAPLTPQALPEHNMNVLEQIAPQLWMVRHKADREVVVPQVEISYDSRSLKLPPRDAEERLIRSPSLAARSFLQPPEVPSTTWRTAIAASFRPLPFGPCRPLISFDTSAGIVAAWQWGPLCINFLASGARLRASASVACRRRSEPSK
jgi:hypothetical protein